MSTMAEHLDPMDLDAKTLIGAVLAGGLAPTRIAEAAIARLDVRDLALGAVTFRDDDGLRAQAEALSERLAAGDKPALAGAPLIVKDNIWVEGARITQGSRLFADHFAPEDAIAVARARDAGALFIGVGACSEFACKGETTTPLHGATRNPWDTTLTPGGSSGGPAAGLAAGMACLAFGTDAGGSGRRPAAHCGVVGFKPSLGAIPYGPGFAEPCWDVSVITPMARTAVDAALLFEAVAGRDARDPSSAVSLAPAREAGALKAVFAPTLGLDVAIDTEVASATASAIEILRSAGFAIGDGAPSWPSGGDEDAIMPMQHAGLAALYGARWRKEPQIFDPEVGAQIESGLALSAADVGAAWEAGRLIRMAVAEFFVDTDILLCPTTPCAAWQVGRSAPETIGGAPDTGRGHAVFTPLLNHARVPAISIPCGMTAAGLPLGLQIIGGFAKDRDVLAYAAAAEETLRDADVIHPTPVRCTT